MVKLMADQIQKILDTIAFRIFRLVFPCSMCKPKDWNKLPAVGLDNVRTSSFENSVQENI